MDKLKGTLDKLAKIGEGMKAVNSEKLAVPQGFILPDVSQITDLSGIKVDYENSVGQKMDRHIALLEEQNEQLQRQNRQLQEQYEFIKQESIKNLEESRKGRRFGWISFITGTTIALLGVIASFLGCIFSK